jgi:G3E family GTPase
MSVSIIAGPSAGKVIDKLREIDAKISSVFEPDPHSTPEQIISELRRIANKGELGCLIVRCEADRSAMAYASLFADRSPAALTNVSRLISAAFAIEAATLLDALLDRKPTALSPCFIAEQIEFVNDIFLEGDGTGSDFELTASIINALNPRARILPLAGTNQSAWINQQAGGFDFEDALNGAGWRKLLDEESSSRRGKVTAFGYHARRPFHPQRFRTLLQEGLPGLFRAKGFFWIATRMDEVGGLNLAGSELQCASAGQWWAARDARLREAEMPARTRREWREPFGDRRQSFAVMALGIDRCALQGQLESCLLTEEEMTGGEEAWRRFADPFPSWSMHVHHHDHDGECDHDHGADEHPCCGH